ncbi:MAG: WG repeat-containing protein [Bacteroidota bacterium]|nr:WG repeat-containing protein [Bacteroidota bacterium]
MSASKISKAYDALKIFDYFKAKKLFYSCLKKEPVLATYGLATIYQRNDNPFHNLDSAYKYIERSYDALLKQPPDFNKRLKKFCLWDSCITGLRVVIHQKSYHYYLQKTKELSVPVLEQFISNQPHSVFIKEAIKKRDSIEFVLLKNTKKSMAIQRFINSFPESEYISVAYEDLDYFRYKEFTQLNNTNRIETFIDSFPKSKYLVYAEDKLFEIAFEQKRTNLLYKYIKQFPKNSHVESAWKNLYSLEVGTYSTNSLNYFITKYPDFPYKQTIEKELELAGVILFVVTKNAKEGFIDTSGKFIIAPEYEGLEEFSDGLSVALRDGKFGYINKAGEVVIPFEFEDAEAFKNGRAIVKKGQDCFLIDRSGNKASNYYDQISDFTENLAIVKLNGLYGAIDRNGKPEIAIQYKRLGDFSEEVAFAQKEEKYGYVDRKGFPVISFLYDWAESFKMSLARVKFNNKFGLINKTGEFVLPPVYDRIDEQVNGVYVIYRNNFYGFADSTGCLLSEVNNINPSSEKATELTNGKWLRLIQEDEQFLMNKNGKLLSEKEPYEEINLPRYGLSKVFINDKYGFVNERNRQVIKPIYDDAENFVDSICIVKKKDVFSVINVFGTPLFSVKTNALEKLSPDYFMYTDEKNILTICNKKGEAVYFPTSDKVYVQNNRYLFSNDANTTTVYDLINTKFILQN